MNNQEAIKILTAKVECMRREANGTDKKCNSNDCDYCELCYAQGTTGEQLKALNMAISALQAQSATDTNVGVMISGTNVIDTEGLDEQIRCEMCRNPMRTNRGCDGNCIYDVNLYKSIMRILVERIRPLPSAQQEVAKDTNVLTNDCISRQTAIDAIKRWGLIDGLSEGQAVEILEDEEKVPSAQPEQRWIPFVLRPATDEEKEENPDLDYYLDGKLPKDGQKILITVRLPGHEEVQADEFYSDTDGSYLDDGYEIGTEAVAWMPLPKPYKEGDE